MSRKYPIDDVALAIVAGRINELGPFHMPKLIKALRVIQVAKLLGIWGLNPLEIEHLIRHCQKRADDAKQW
jgi:hypothetical protein